MGIDIYMYWKGGDLSRFSSWAEDYPSSPPEDLYTGKNGYLRESYFAPAYATPWLVPEAFIRDMDKDLENYRNWNKDMRNSKPLFCSELVGEKTFKINGKEFTDEVWAAKIPAELMKSRLIKVRERCLARVENDFQYAEEHYQEIINFINLAEEKERETGEPVWIYASW